MELVDTHCHLDVDAFDSDREAVLAHARANGVQHIIIPGIHTGNWQPLLGLCRQHRGLYPALGLHPVYWQQHKNEHIDQLRDAVRDHHPVAIGEIGLDYYIENPDKSRQQELLELQLDVAAENNLPVILHVRKAHNDMLACLKRKRVCGGTAHAFNGSMQQAEEYIELGFKLGFGGMLTFERSTKLRKLARDLPLDTLVLETDAPDMTVASHHGERNSPEYLPECLDALASIRREDRETIAAQTTRNALDVFRIES